MVLRIGVSLIGCLSRPHNGLLVALGSTLAPKAHAAKDALRVGVSLARSALYRAALGGRQPTPGTSPALHGLLMEVHLKPAALVYELPRSGGDFRAAHGPVT